MINTGRNPALAAEIGELKTDGRCPDTVVHRRVSIRTIGSRVPANHGRPKRILGPKRGFQTPAYRRLKGMDAMHALRKEAGADLLLRGLNPDAAIAASAVAYA